MCFYSLQFYKNTLRDPLIKATQITIFRTVLRLKCKQDWDFLAIARSLKSNRFLNEVGKIKSFSCSSMFQNSCPMFAWMKSYSRYLWLPVCSFLLVAWHVKCHFTMEMEETESLIYTGNCQGPLRHSQDKHCNKMDKFHNLSLDIARQQWTSIGSSDYKLPASIERFIFVWDTASDQAWWLMNVLPLREWPYMKKITHCSEGVSHDNINHSKLIHSQSSSNYEGPGKWKGMFCFFHVICFSFLSSALSEVKNITSNIKNTDSESLPNDTTELTGNWWSQQFLPVSWYFQVQE